MVMVTAFALFVAVRTQTAMSTVQSEVLAIEKMRLAATEKGDWKMVTMQNTNVPGAGLADYPPNARVANRCPDDFR